MSVLAHVVESITPASGAQAEAARRRVAGAGVPMLERLAVALAAAQHSARPRTRKTIVVVAGGAAAAPLAHAIADGTAALCGVARTTGTPIVLVQVTDSPFPASAVQLADTIEAGIALAVSLEQADVLAVGVIGEGGRDLLAGLMLSAASTNVPVILDGAATGEAAIVAAAHAPLVTGYLIAAHAGLRQAAELGLTPVFEVGLGHGEGTGAAMVLPLIDQLAALAATTPA